MPNIECEHCGGTDFYKEAGYFFCKGCQVQSQEVQEYLFDDYVAVSKPKTRKVQSTKSDKVDNKITSWECYNYILLGLTEELINLGANKKLKAVVRILWLRYLEKLQVFKRGKNELPKLQAVCSGMDGEIVYGKLAKRKRKRNKSSSSELEATSIESSSMKQERIKRKRALIKAQYDDYTQKSQATSSLHNETLTSLQTGSEKSSKHVTPISYNIYASRELRRIKKSKSHWFRHRVDFENTLKCHRVSYRKLSKKHRTSPCILSLNKLYSLLYLALLILRDKIQLSDILRYIKEGHLTFNCYDHFFPDDFSDRTLNFRNFKKNTVFVSASFRMITLEMASFLQVRYYISCPDLLELCERYCTELNLPHQVCDCAKNILSRSNIRMSCKQTTKIPNYEGRILSIILFVLKLLFGLDDITEFHLGKYSEILNNTGTVHSPMFSIIEWLKYIEYRNLVLTSRHFPTSFSNNDDICNIDLALSVLARKEYPSESKVNANKDNYKQLFIKLKDHLEEPENIDFPVTLTPFLDYTKLLPKADYLQLLSEDFSNHNLSHVLKPVEFLNVINKGAKIEIVNGGANLNWIVEKVTCPKQEYTRDLKDKRKFVTVKLCCNSKPETLNNVQKSEPSIDTLVKNFQVANEHHFQRNQKLLEGENYRKVTEFDLKEIRLNLDDSSQTYLEHYNPYERFWLRCKLGIEELTQRECRKFLETFPYNFQLIFRECQRIAQQSEQELLIEYQFTELYLIFNNFGKQYESQKVFKEKLISNYLDKYKYLW